MSTRLQLKDIRFNYANGLFTAQKPQQNQAGKEKFNCVALIPKDHPQLGEIKATMIAAAEAKWGAKAADVIKQLQAADKLCLHDGDAKADKPGFKGNFFINASNEIRPTVVGPSREPLVASDGKPYSGSYGNIILDFWAQDNQFGKRINATLCGAQFVKDGERLSGGGVAAADDFEPIPEATAQQPAVQKEGASALF